MRQLYPLSEVGMENPEEAVTPVHMRIVGDDFSVKKPQADFRMESKLSNYDKPVVMQIEVRHHAGDEFERIGEISLREDTISTACDEALHFHHPKWRE